MRVEIQDLPVLSERETIMCEMHSFFNVMNVVLVELQLLQKMAATPDAFAKSLAVCEDAVESFTSRAMAMEKVSDFETIVQTIKTDIAEAETAGALDEEHRKFWKDSVENLQSIFTILETRVKEILARAQAMSPWQEYPLDTLEQALRLSLTAIEKNAHGRYRILYHPEAPADGAYCIKLEFSSQNGSTISIPPVLRDVLRDLIANARKYSTPNSTITAHLEEDAEAIVCEVADEGRGIPEDEIATVVQFGKRGSNTIPEETKGGGFGLTKAFLVCQQYKGRMWIDSALGGGCRITLRLPKRAA